MAQHHDFKVKNGLVVADSGTFGNTITGTNAVFTGSVTASNILDSADVIGIIASEGLDSNLVISIVDSAYVKLRDRFQDSGLVTSTVTKTYVDALNIDADTLDGQTGTFYLDYNNFINVPSNSGLDSADVISLIDSDYIELRRPPETVFNIVNNGASAYTFTGDGFSSSADNPTLYLTRGKRYKFSVNASGHPLQIRLSSGGTTYNNGVSNNGVQTGTMYFTPDMSAPTSLVYQCTVHSGMVGNIVILDDTDAGLDSANVISLIDSAYIQARQTTGGGLDSASVISLIDSDYVTQRVDFSAASYSALELTAVATGSNTATWTFNTNDQAENFRLIFNGLVFPSTSTGSILIFEDAAGYTYAPADNYNITGTDYTITATRNNNAVTLSWGRGNFFNATGYPGGFSAAFTAGGGKVDLIRVWSGLRNVNTQGGQNDQYLLGEQISSGNYFGSNPPIFGVENAATAVYTSVNNVITSTVDSAYVTGRVDFTGNIDSAYVQLRQSYNYNSLINRPEKVSTWSNDAGYITDANLSDYNAVTFVGENPEKTEYWVVPAGVTSISVVAIGGGGGGGEAASGTNGIGGGGGLAYDTALTVTPGETLKIVAGSRGSGGLAPSDPPGSIGTGSAGGNTYLYRGSSTVLLQADGGTGASGGTNGTGGDGGTTKGYDGGGDGGVRGAGQYSTNGTASGGASVYGSSDTNYNYGEGGPGQGLGQYGALRIIWGANRSYPNTNITQSFFTIYDSDLGSGGGTVDSADIIAIVDSAYVIERQLKSHAIGGKYRFDTSTTAGDPGSGDIRLSIDWTTGVEGSSYNAYVSETDKDGVGIAPLLDQLTVSTNTNKALVIIYKADAPTTNAKFYVTGQTDNGSYRTLDITYVDRDAWGQISNGDEIFMSLSIIGDKGDIGSGIDSAAVTSIIDSDYIQARQTTGGGGIGTVDSAYVLSVVDSATLPITQKFYHFTADSGQTTFSGFDDDSDTLVYTAGALAIYLNGILLVDSADYTASNGTSITLTDASVAGDVLTVQRFGGNSIYTNAIPFSQTFYHFTATGGQTTFSGSDDDADTLQYSAGHIAVYLNGILLVDSADYTASNGTSIVLTDPAVNGDVLSILKFGGNTVGVDSAGIINLIDSAYIQARTVAGTDSAAIIQLIDSAYIQARQVDVYRDSGFVTGIVNSSYIQSLQTTYDFLDSAEAIALIDSAYINARIGAGTVEAIVDSAYIQLRDRFQDSAGILAIVDSAYVQARQTNVFNNIHVSGQDSIEANSANGILTFEAGLGITITTDANTDTVTIAGHAEVDSAFITNIIDSAYINGRVSATDSASVISIINTTVDSDYIGTKVDFTRGEFVNEKSQYTATAAQTVFNHSSIDPTHLDVYLNGILQVADDDYTASTSAVTFTTGVDSGYSVTIVEKRGRILTQRGLVENKYYFTTPTPITSITGADDNGTTLDYSDGFLDVYLNGVLLKDSDDYSTNAGTTVTLVSATDSNDLVTLINRKGVVVSPNIKNYEFTADSAQTLFTGSDTNGNTLSYVPGAIQVYLNGILLQNTDFTAINGSSITLTSPSILNDELAISVFSNPGQNMDMYKFTADSGQIIFSGNDLTGASLAYQPGNIQVFMNGLLLNDSDDYTAINGMSVVLTTGADLNDEIKIASFVSNADVIRTNRMLWSAPSGTPVAASAGDRLFIDTSTAKTVTLPPSATMGDEIRIIDVTGNASTNNITVSRNGHNIQGAASDLTINIDRAGIGLVYYNSAQGWVLIEN